MVNLTSTPSPNYALASSLPLCLLIYFQIYNLKAASGPEAKGPVVGEEDRWPWAGVKGDGAVVYRVRWSKGIFKIPYLWVLHD